LPTGGESRPHWRSVPVRLRVGTGFLRAPEARTPVAWAEALAGAAPEDTIVSRVFSGRAGRSLATDYVRAATSERAPRPAPYPVQRGLTAAMRAAATKVGDVRRMQAWAGQSAALARAEPAAKILQRLWADAVAILRFDYGHLPEAGRAPQDSRTTSSQLRRTSRGNHVAPRDPLEHHRKRRFANLAGRLTQSRQRHRQETGVVHIIDAHQPHIIRNPVLELQQRMHQMSCGAVVGAGDAIRMSGLHDRPDTLDVVCIHAVRQGAIELHTGRVQCLAVTGFALIDGRGGVFGANEQNAPTSEAQEMLRDDVSGTTIVNANEGRDVQSADTERGADPEGRREFETHRGRGQFGGCTHP